MTLDKLWLQKLLIGVFVLVVLAPSSSRAVTTSIWEVQTSEEFQAGKPKNVAITGLGEVALSPKLLLISKTDELYIWCLTVDFKGNLYAGSGHEGKIFKITRAGKLSLLFDSPELEILSLAIDGQGNLYAGTAPEGIIYKITPQGEVSTFFDSPEKYIWALVFDQQGYLYAGTGDGGKIYRVSRDGGGEVIFDSEETHILSLVMDEEGNIYAGGEGRGIVYKLTPKGGVRVLYDAPQGEIHCLTLGADRTLYVGAIGGQRDLGKSLEVSSSSPQDTHSSGKQTETRSVIYRITPDGAVLDLWACPQPLVLALMVTPDGNLMVGTGNQGMVYLLTPEGEATTLLKLDQSQVLSLCLGNRGDIFLGTGNPGEVYRLTRRRYHRAGTLTSPVHDATVVSRWGRIRWEGETPGGTTITLATRTGNTEEPDQTWSGWSNEYTQPSGERITSPPARFIQWRAKLSTSKNSTTPVLRKVSVAYLQQNLKPEIISLTVHPPGKGITKTPTEGLPEARPEGTVPEETEGFPQVRPLRRIPFKKAIRMISWKATDPNRDSLLYSLYFKGVEERNWKLLKENLKVNRYTWDTEAVPDGVYLVKVVATDSPSNPPEGALAAERQSHPFVVDNTPPQVVSLKTKVSPGGKLVITGKAVDQMSPLKRGEYSVDAGRWQTFLPIDGIFDSEEEAFSFIIGPLSPGEHTVVIKVVDAIGNVGAGKRVIERGK